MPTSVFTSKLVGQRIVVVGGSSGIGFSVAQACLEFGAEVIIASSSQSKVNAAVKRLQESSSKISGKIVDLRGGDKGPAGIDTRVDELLSGIGKFNHYVHTAGESLAFAPLEEADLTKAAEIFDIRYFAVIAAAKAIKKHNLLKDGGSMILTSGTVYLKPGKNWFMVAGVGGAVVSLTRSLAVDLAPIRANCVVPGPVDTELWDSLPTERRTKLKESMADSALTGKMPKPHDVAEIYLACMRDTSITGQAINSEAGTLLKPS